MWTNWKEGIETKFVASDPANEEWFGLTTALSTDGNTALIGRPGAGLPWELNRPGGAYVLTRTDLGWEETKLSPTTPIDPDRPYQPQYDERLGEGLALSFDGTVAIVGGPLFDGANGTNSGHAVVYTKTDHDWVQTAQLTAWDGQPSEAFGRAVDVSADGTVAAIGGQSWESETDLGQVYVFSFNGTTWQTVTRLDPVDVPGDDYIVRGRSGFGLSVATSADGTVVVTGAKANGLQSDPGGGAPWFGEAYVYEQNGTSWSPTILRPADGIGYQQFGDRVDLSADGDTAIIGGAYDNGQRGAAYIFAHTVSGWEEVSKLTASDGYPGHLFGVTVALSPDGDVAVVGASRDDEKAEDAGAAYVFVNEDGEWEEVAKLTASDGQVYDDLPWKQMSLSYDGTSILVGAHNHDDGPTNNAGAAYLFEFSRVPDTAFLGLRQNTTTFEYREEDALVATYPVATNGAASDLGDDIPLTLRAFEDGDAAATYVNEGKAVGVRGEDDRTSGLKALIDAGEKLVIEIDQGEGSYDEAFAALINLEQVKATRGAAQQITVEAYADDALVETETFTLGGPSHRESVLFDPGEAFDTLAMMAGNQATTFTFRSVLLDLSGDEVLV